MLTVNREALLTKLSIVSNAVARRSTLPILSNVYLGISDGRMKLIGHDMETQIESTLEGLKSEEDTEFTVSCKKFIDVLKAIDSDEAKLDFDGKKLVVKAGKSKFTLQTLPGVDFPKIKTPDEFSSTLKLSQRELKRILSNVNFCAPASDTRYYLNGVLLVVEKGFLRAVGTDGHRLAYCHTAQTQIEKGIEVILPKDAVGEIIRLLADSEDEVAISFAQVQCRFELNDVVMISKLVEGKFPDYKRVIPATHSNVMLVHKAEILPALQRAALLTNDKYRGVRLELSTGNLALRTDNMEQENSSEDLEVEYSGDVLSSGFNIVYLLDVVQTLKCERIQFAFSDGQSSVLVTAEGASDFKYVTMPMRI